MPLDTEVGEVSPHTKFDVGCNIPVKKSTIF